MSLPSLNLLHVKAIALAVTDLERATRFYTGTLALRPAVEDGQPVGVHLGDTVLLLKTEWYGQPTAFPNPRVTLETANARDTESALRERGVIIGDPVERYGEALVGSFFDSEGNKLWFCSGAGPS
jgi:catechol-2,3-dioxygenase